MPCRPARSANKFKRLGRRPRISRLNLTHGDGLLEVGGELVGLLDLDELAGGDHVPEDLEEGAVVPGLALVVGLDVGLDRGTTGAGAVLELADGGDDSCLVHG